VFEGPGIPEELLGSLFKPFQRGSDSNTQKAQGIGLGLRFVDVALKRLGSQVEFESSAKGTSFYFVISTNCSKAVLKVNRF
jgi:two-component system sensor histidine kinase AdeS